MSGGRVQAVADRLVQRAKPHVPVAVKRTVKGLLPKRYHRHFDPDWHRRTIGNVPFWDYLGKLQFDYLVAHGLRPEHRLLDIGCGPLRGGIHFIAYLQPGHYSGVEKNPEQLEEARRVELPRNNLVDRRPTLVAMEDFAFERLGQRFDFALAQSVFTHLSLNSIIRCLVNLDRVLVPGGRFYATYFENPDGKRNLDSIRQSSTAVSHFDRDRFHYDVASFEWACQGLDLEPQPLGEWGHPQHQKMMEFTKRG